MLGSNQNIQKKIYEFSVRYCFALWIIIATFFISQSIFAVTFDSTAATARFEVTGTTQSPIVRGGSGTQVITVQNKGPNNATNTVAIVKASLSTGVTIASVTSSVGSCSGSGAGPYTCSIGSVVNAGTFILSITYNVSLAASVGTAQQIAVSVNSDQYNPGSGSGEILHNAWGAIGAETTASQYGAFWVGRTSTTATCNTKSSPCLLGSASEEGDALLSAWPKDQVNPTGQYLNSAVTGNNNDTYFTSDTTNPTVSQVVPNISTYAYKSLVLSQGSNFVNNRRAWQFSSYLYIPASTTSVSLCVGTSGAMIDDGAYITLKKSTDSTRTVVQSPRDTYDSTNAYVVTTTGLSSGYYELVYRMVNQNNVSSGENAPGQYGAVGMSFNGGSCTDANLQNALTAGFPTYISIVNPDSDLAITKTNNTSLAVGGTSTDYIVRVTNNGPDAAVGAILKDAAVASLTKTAIACTTTASNKCTSGTTPTIIAIESGSGYTLPTLANGEFYELKITATVASTSTLTSVSNTATVTAPANTTDSVSTNNSATDTDSIRARIRIAKISNNGFGSFNFTGLTNLQDSSGNSVTTDTVTTIASGSAVTSSNSLYSSNLNNAVLISETIPANYNLSSASCIDSNAANSGNPATAFGTLSSGQLTIPAANIVAGANIVCTFTNNRKSATFRIAKAWGANSVSGNVAQIAATTGLTNNTSALTSTAPTNLNGSSVTVYAGETVTLPVETMTTGNLNNYNTILSCSAGGGATANSLSGTNGQSSNSLTVGDGDESKLITCTYTNTRKSTTLTLRKTWANAKLNDAATVSATGLTSLSSTANTANETDAGTAQTVYAGDVITLLETITTGAGNYTAGLACTGNTTALSGSQLTVNASDSSVVCTYTNTRKSATLTLRKTWANAKIADSVTVNSAGFINNASVSSIVTTSGNDTATSTIVTVYAGEIGTIVESFIVGNPTDYNSSLACSGTTGLVGNSLTINANDTNVLCVYTNSRVTQVIISGKVFDDNSGTTNNIANAYNGIQDNGELGIANSLILLNDCSSTQVATIKTNANGEYSFSVNQNSLPSSFCIVQQNLPEYISVSGTNGYTRSTDTIALTKTSATSYTANNFGDVIVNVVLSEDGQHTVIAGDVTDYPHRLTTQTPVQLTQLLQTQTQQPNSSIDQQWQALIYRDTNCNGQVDMGEVVFSPSVASSILLQPSVDICLVQRVHVPTNVVAGAQHIGTLKANYQFALTNPAETISKQTVKRQDVTLIGSAGLTLTKKVRAVANCSSTPVDSNGFVTNNEVQKIDNLEYEIIYKNNSSKKLQNVKIKDSLPIGTNFGSISCASTPSGNTCSATSLGSSLQWNLTGVLNPAATGALRFCVTQ
ncbi:beta strand repeat-containing protein [Acinetobacter kyonggiensis]|uniref:Uncharacterized protein n=1 Tax=Acinetobacter kyonggiensis TaxID=595670 RepID=A0A1H3KSU7_9GAMM|nr:SdrD B-like domain-containing protein [Acinetobacter kyonggiensis]SDY55096.1 protein of unknown function DUF11 [Acinetobacter kyonggiensis]